VPSQSPTIRIESQPLTDPPQAEGKCADVLDAATCNYQRRCSWNRKLRPGMRCVQHANQCKKFWAAAGCRRHSSECKWLPRAKAGTRCQLQASVAVSPLIVLSAPTPAPTLAPTRTSCSYAVDAADCNKQPVCVWRPQNKPGHRCAQLPNQCAKLSGTTCQNHPDCDWQPKSKTCKLMASASIATTNFTPKPTAAPTPAPTAGRCSHVRDATTCSAQEVCSWRPKNKAGQRCVALAHQCAKFADAARCSAFKDGKECGWAPKAKAGNRCQLQPGVTAAHFLAAP
jgi:hypothetical protein